MTKLIIFKPRAVMLVNGTTVALAVSSSLHQFFVGEYYLNYKNNFCSPNFRYLVLLLYSSLVSAPQDQSNYHPFMCITFPILSGSINSNEIIKRKGEKINNRVCGDFDLKD
ncbi:hypothetical protein BpHYR1_036895 [Brachionus plicatilis]|uniref:Uncharacterized protein n=1 Tax=Brachionus plicatilis TaxID=10195 RepID=A0A3M7R3F0_BRAPC|nr:hypothetical protein BpHYR1_036895 [Brachionus plicatilis]